MASELPCFKTYDMKSGIQGEIAVVHEVFGLAA